MAPSREVARTQAPNVSLLLNTLARCGLGVALRTLSRCRRGLSRAETRLRQLRDHGGPVRAR